MENDSIKIDIAKAQEAINHLKEAHKEIKEYIRELDRSLQDKSEEIKDTFYLAETTRKRLEELSESLTETFKNYDDLLSKKEERKEKKVLGIVQAIVTVAAIAYAVFVK